jgi:hypothetical protein
MAMAAGGHAVCCAQGVISQSQRSAIMAHPQNESGTKQQDDQRREAQRSHGDEQNRTKKDGHVSQIGTGADQNSSRQQGQGARRQK